MQIDTNSKSNLYQGISKKKRIITLLLIIGGGTLMFFQPWIIFIVVGGIIILNVVLVVYALVIKKKRNKEDPLNKLVLASQYQAPAEIGSPMYFIQIRRDARIKFLQNHKKLVWILNYLYIPLMIVWMICFYGIVIISNPNLSWLKIDFFIPLLPIISSLVTIRVLTSDPSKVKKGKYPKKSTDNNNSATKNVYMPEYQWRAEHMAPLNVNNKTNSTRADNFTKEGVKIQQECPFCGFSFLGKRDTCPKCKKLI